MQEIINCINQAEQQAAEIKGEAVRKAAEIAENAEGRSADILKLSEAELKAFREKSVKAAEEEAEKMYLTEITVNRAKAAQYCADKLKDTDKLVNDIVRRITRGSR